MTIALFATESALLQSVNQGLIDAGLDVRAIDWISLRNLQYLAPEISKGVLIVHQHGAGEPTTWVRRLLTEERRLILCAPQTDAAGYCLLKEVGATEVITPRTWEPEQVIERILSQLILDGDVSPSSCGRLQGASRAMRKLYRDIGVVATLDDPVLILGETGTGKELVAGEVHRLSGRPGELLAVNCGELSLELTGSDLFGHKRGAFTGATEARRGLLAEAGQGTIFLDEIGELDLKAQAFLLRVLEDRKVRRVGSNQTEDVAARIILATNRDLETESEEGGFRRDLLERIRGFPLEVPLLRERLEDISLLVHYFLTEFALERNRNLHIPDGALDCLFGYDWPNNVRELRNAVRKAAAYADQDDLISALHLLESTQRGRKRRQFSEGLKAEDAKYYVTFDPNVDTWRAFIERAQTIYFQALLNATRGNKREAQRRSGLSSSQFYEKIKPIQ